MTLREQIELQADSTASAPSVGSPHPAAVPTSGTEIPYHPFPVETLPPAVQAIVSEAACAIGCDPAAVALPAISGLGVAIGNTRLLQAKKDWRVPPIIWAILAMPSGSQKSPALDITADYFRERQAKLHADYRQRLAAESAKKNRKDRVAVDPNVVWADDSTTEALAVAMETNPRGILLASDELGNWLGGMGLYKRNGAIADLSRTCQWHGGRGTMILRKDAERPVTFAKGLLGITGAMTMRTLQALTSRAVVESGLLARMLPCCPPTHLRRWTDDVIGSETTRAFHDLLDGLFKLEKMPCGPQLVGLGAEAKRALRETFNRHNKEKEALVCDDLRAAWSKLEELPCRLALILHECDGGGPEISLEVMERAITLAEWFKHETRRVYALLFGRSKAPAALADSSKLLDWMEGRDWVTERDISRGLACFRGTSREAAIQAALTELITRGLVQSEEQTAGKGGGRPTMKYRLLADQDAAESPPVDKPKAFAIPATQLRKAVGE